MNDRNDMNPMNEDHDKKQPLPEWKHSQITLLSGLYDARAEEEGASWQALGITTMVDGWLREFFDTLKAEMPEMPEDMDVFRAILFAGMDEMRRQLDARRVEKDL